jgi:hypothetical protein
MKFGISCKLPLPRPWKPGSELTRFDNLTNQQYRAILNSRQNAVRWVTRADNSEPEQRITATEQPVFYCSFFRRALRGVGFPPKNEHRWQSSGENSQAVE